MEISPVEWVVIGVVAGAVYLKFKDGGRTPSQSVPLICTECGTRGDATTETRGNRFIELLLWLCFIVPGLIYSIWRRSSDSQLCPACGHATMIPVDTPRGRQLLQQFVGGGGQSKQNLP